MGVLCFLFTDPDLHLSSAEKRFSELDSEIRTFYGEKYLKSCKLLKFFSLMCLLSGAKLLLI